MDCNILLDNGRHCGDFSTYEGETILCDSCLRKAKRQYPQGWKFYPGDICKHGTYVGGCGVDLLCPACEA